MATTLIIGASEKPERYANKALQALITHNEAVVLFNPKGGVIQGIPVKTELDQITESVDTATVYVNPRILSSLLPDIIQLKPKRIILNPGTEDLKIQHFLEKENIEVIEACTLVLLNTDNY